MSEGWIITRTSRTGDKFVLTNLERDIVSIAVTFERWYPDVATYSLVFRRRNETVQMMNAINELELISDDEQLAIEGTYDQTAD